MNIETHDHGRYSLSLCPQRPVQSAESPSLMPASLSKHRRIDDFDTEMLAFFDFDPRTRVVYGAGTINQLGRLTRELGGTRVLVVTDRGVEHAGHAEKSVSALRQSGMDVAVFNEVQSNPTTDDVDRGVAAAKANHVDFLVAVGGGSSMDCAKGINFLLTNGGQMKDYWGMNKATRPMLPSIAIPTTAGTGSEAQSFALIADAKTHLKMACGDKKAACRVAILDPHLTLSMPASVTAATGIDAISHALESYVTTKRNPVSQLFGRRAWKLLANGFLDVVRGTLAPRQETPMAARSSVNQSSAACQTQSDQDRLDSQTQGARGAMLLGAHLAGAAIENSMLGAAHALANPLTACIGLTHGLAIGLMLPHVLRFNARHVGSLYGRLSEDIGLCAADDPQAGEALAQHVTLLVKTSGSPTCLSDVGLDETLLPQLAAEAAKQWTGEFNPRPVDPSNLLELYKAAFNH